MAVDLNTSPEAFVDKFFNSYVNEVVLTEIEPEQGVDRYYTPDFVQVSDGAETTRAQLAEHVPAARQTFATMRYEVQEALLSGDTLATRLTFHADFKTGGSIEVDFYVFAEVAEDRRLRRIHQVTHTAKNDMASS